MFGAAIGDIVGSVIRFRKINLFATANHVDKTSKENLELINDEEPREK